MKNIDSKKIITWIVGALIMLQPIIDMDYLIYDFLNQFSIPRFSTIIRFIIIPLLVLWTFFTVEKKQKHVFVLAGGYGISLLVFYVLHSKQALALYPRLNLTTNFEFNYFQELTYLLTLVLPFAIVYCSYHAEFKEDIIKKITMFSSAIIGIPIVLGDVFLFGKSTYEGYTQAPFYMWFFGIYETYHPRVLASKFFFNEGNTIGILMFMILPLLYYFFSMSTSKKEKGILVTLIVVQSLAMQILSTRVATYGAILIPVVFLVLYLFDRLLLKRDVVKVDMIILTIVCFATFVTILPYTPAVVNQKIDAKNDLALIDNGAADEGKSALKNAKDLIPGTKEFNNFYIFMFEQYGIRAKYASSIPKIYYDSWYHYKFDPKFWVDMILDRPVEERVGGRRIQKIFMDYKYENLTSKEKLLGMGYSTFMNGSILIEKDYTQQVYTLGYIGTLLTIVPWIIVVGVCGLLVLIKWKKLLTLEITTYALVLLSAIGSAYISGHVLDQFLTTTFMAFILAILMKRIGEAYGK